MGVLQSDVEAVEGVQLHPHPRNELAILRVARLEALLERAFGLAQLFGLALGDVLVLDRPDDGSDLILAIRADDQFDNLPRCALGRNA